MFQHGCVLVVCEIPERRTVQKYKRRAAKCIWVGVNCNAFVLHKCNASELCTIFFNFGSIRLVTFYLLKIFTSFHTNSHVAHLVRNYNLDQQ